MTQTLTFTELPRAAALLQAGKTVAFPTETVYGLGADATSDKAVAAIFMAKDRPRFNPLIVHLPDLGAARELVTFTPEAEALAKAFWPGPMSLVLPKRPDAQLSDLVTAGLDTVAIRIPAHPLARELLAQTGLPIAAPSANPSGRISPTTAEHVRTGLEGRIAAILDGGPCSVGLESTIFGGSPIALLRPGGITREDAEAVLGHPIAEPDIDASKPNAPGQLSSHYAPSASVILDAAPRDGRPHLAFGAGSGDLNLSESADLQEAAANLFAMLRQMDEICAQKSAAGFSVAPIPKTGLGAAIRDRLTRAAAPRD